MNLHFVKDPGFVSVYDLYAGDKKAEGWWVAGPYGDGTYHIRTPLMRSATPTRCTIEEARALVMAEYAMRNKL
jgi:hypothetical protein